MDAGGTLENWDPFVRAIGVIRGKHLSGPIAIITHPFVQTHLDLLKQPATLATMSRPDGVPTPSTTTQLPRDADANTASAIVFALQAVRVVRRQDVRVEVDRSREFDLDAVLIRSKLRARLFAPYAEGIVRIDNLPAPDPAVIPTP